MSERRPFSISFSGIDGAGKTTQIARLTAAFQSKGLSVQIVTFWDDIVVLKPLREGVGHKVFKGDQGVGSPEAPIERRDKNVRSPLLSVFRMILYGLDAISVNWKARKILGARSSSRPDVVIFDRYLFDELANLALEQFGSRLYIRMLLWYVSRPQIALILDADPVEAFARKPEYPLEFLHSNRNAYLNLARLAGMTVISAGTVDQAQEQIKQTILTQNRDLASGW